MSKSIPVIAKFMTTTPHSIGVEQTVAEAQAMMKKFNIRHLPVLHGGKLVGLISERDIALIETLRDVDPKQVTVEDAMSQEVYSVSPTASLAEVVSEMADKKYGSAVVLDNNQVIGMFTTVDVCRAFGELLKTRLSS